MTTRPISSIGTDSFQATLFGAPALQPSNSDGDGMRKRGVTCGGFVILTVLFLPLTIYLITVVKGWFMN